MDAVQHAEVAVSGDMCNARLKDELWRKVVAPAQRLPGLECAILSHAQCRGQ